MVPAPGQSSCRPRRTDALARLKDRVGKALFERMGARMNDPSLSEDALRIVLGELDEVVEEENVPLSTEERVRLTAELADDVLGYGPLQRLLDDSAVSEIMVNGPDAIYVERSGKLERTATRFTSRSICGGSSTASSPGWDGGSTSRPRWSTLAWPTDPRQRDHPAAGVQRVDAHDPEVLQGPLHRRDLISFGTLSRRWPSCSTPAWRPGST